MKEASRDWIGNPTGRLTFANQLRGLAALSVVFGHYVGLYWGGRELVSTFTATPIETGPETSLYFLASQPWFNFGPFGVSIFFLISGLVIPISLAHHSSAGFIAARIVRIMPTYWVGASLCLLVVWLNSKFWDIAFPPGFDSRVIAGTLMLVNNYLKAVDFTFVAWTLCIEWKFYIICAVIAPAIRRGNISTLFQVALVCLALNLLWRVPLVQSAYTAVPQIWTIGFETTFLVFMLIGVLFNYHVRGLINGTTLGASILALAAIFVASFALGPAGIEFPNTPVNYGYGLLVFSAAYAFKAKFRPILFLDFLAKISYPLYVIHSVVGYSTFKLLMGVGKIPFSLAFPMTVSIVMTIAAVIHLLIERPSIQAGRHIGGRVHPVAKASSA